MGKELDLKVEEIAGNLRQEPYSLLRNDCIIKSVRFARECRQSGIPAKVVLCIGLVKAKILTWWLVLPVIHAWGEVNDRRIEVSRPLGASGMLGIVPRNIRPIVVAKF